MGEVNNVPSLAEVIDEYVMSAGTPGRAVLAEWTGRYPQYAEELLDFTVSWARVEWVPPASAPAADEERLQLLGLSLARRKLAALQNATPVLKGLLAEAKAKGLAPGQVAAAAGLSVPLLTKLDRRLIRAASVPRQVVDALAGALNAATESVAAYLQGPALHAQAAHFMADKAPALPEQQDFAAAVRADRTLGAEDKARLLSLD